MSDLGTQPSAGVAAGLSQWQRVTNTFTAPSKTFEDIKSGHKSWWMPFLIMVILGGIGSLLGPALGSGIFLLMKNLVSSYTQHWMLIIGVVFISCVLFFPGGVWGALRAAWMWRRAP